MAFLNFSEIPVEREFCKTGVSVAGKIIYPGLYRHFRVFIKQIQFKKTKFKNK